MPTIKQPRDPNLIKKWKEQSLDTWDILTDRVARGEGPIHYSHFSELLLKKTAPRACSKPLGIVLTYCRVAELPELPSIVVTKRTLRPAEGAPYDETKVSAAMRTVLNKWGTCATGQRPNFEAWLDERDWELVRN